MAKKKNSRNYDCLDRKDIPSEKMELVHLYREFTFEASQPFSYETSEKMFSEFAEAIGCKLISCEKVNFAASPAIKTNSLVLENGEGKFFLHIDVAENIGHTTWRLTFVFGNWSTLCLVLDVDIWE